MRNRIVMAAALSLCMQVFASGGIIKEDFVKEGFVPSQPPAEVIYTADTPLRFKVISESAVEVIYDKSYNELKTVIIPSKVRIEGREYDVTSIGEGAFSHCSGLTGIKLPPSVTKIGDGAFWNCSGLTGIKILPSVTKIGDGAFHDCSGLTGINVSPDNPNYSSVNGVLYNKSQTEIICCPGGIKGKVKLPASVTKIGDGAFYSCSGLTGIELPPSVTEIGYEAFLGCSGLTGIKIPPSVTKIGEGAFADCSGLTGIEIPSSVTRIGDRAFLGCSGLTGIKIPSSVTKIGEAAFSDCSGLTGIEIPASVTDIGSYAFLGCSGLTGIEITSSVTKIGSYAFDGCKNLDVTIDNSEGNVEIRYDAFRGCKSVRYLK